MYKKVLFTILEALSKNDNERAHTLALRAIQTLQYVPFAIRFVAHWYEMNDDLRHAFVSGIQFHNRIGLAAGFDKNAQMLPFLQALGFGFIEVGTVTPRPQVGNPRPRLIRIPAQHALWNWMGFNSDGAKKVAKRLAKVRSRIHIPIGGSLGKQKETTLDDAARDHIVVLHALAPYVDYYTVNVSSPNTPGLRHLQGRKYLETLVHDVVVAEMVRALSRAESPKPVFVKLAPDQTDEEMAVSLEAIERGGASGIIVGNTTVKHPTTFPSLRLFQDSSGNPRGGYSGKFQFDRTLAMVKFMRKRTTLSIIACGGVTSRERAAQLYGEGASLVQILTGFVYQGPALIRQLRYAG